MLVKKVFVRKKAYDKLLKHVCATNFLYETGGVLLGYRYWRIYYITDVTFPCRCGSNSRMTFVLNGEEHTRQVIKIIKNYLIPPRLIGVWHSHTTDDGTLSLQDEQSNRILVNQMGELLSMIVIRTKSKSNIQLIAYCELKDFTTFLCDVKIGLTGRQE